MIYIHIILPPLIAFKEILKSFVFKLVIPIVFNGTFAISLCNPSFKSRGDSTRNATGRTGGAIGGGSGALITNSGAVYWVQGANHFASYYGYIDFSRALPTANEIRPVNRAVRYLIRAKQ